MPEFFSRTELIIGSAGLRRLAEAKVAVFGLGGVGSFAVEALVRTGVGKLVLVDHDRVNKSNLNRQLIATRDTVGRLKVEVMAERIESINPAVSLDIYPLFYDNKEEQETIITDCDYIIDAIDTVGPKVLLLENAKKRKIAVVSSMGAGNKVDPEKLRLTDISQTHTCPLARIIRRELRKRGIYEGIKVVFSPERPVASANNKLQSENGKPIVGSISFVPPVAGFLLASVVIRDLVGLEV